MSKLITDYTKAKDLKLDVSGFIINFKPYSLFPKYRFSLEEVKKIIPKIRKENKLVFLNMDALIREKDLENLNIDIAFPFALYPRASRGCSRSRGCRASWRR